MKDHRHFWLLLGLNQVVFASPAQTLRVSGMGEKKLQWKNAHFIIVPCHTIVEMSFQGKKSGSKKVVRKGVSVMLGLR